MNNRYGPDFPSLDTVFSGALVCAAAIMGLAIVFDPSVLTLLT